MRARRSGPEVPDAHFFGGKRHPGELGGPEVTRFLSSLAVDGRVAASTQNEALNALRFLYRDVLGVELPRLDGAVRAKRRTRLPFVLTRGEVRAVIRHLSRPPRLMACLLYGAGLRVLECCRLRVQDLDIAATQIIVRGGKGDKDRTAMLPAVVKPDLRRHIGTVRADALYVGILRRKVNWVLDADIRGFLNATP